MIKEYGGMPMRFAHTGVIQFAPENTLEAFEKAAELGFEGIELDIKLSVDQIKRIDIPFKSRRIYRVVI